MDLLLKIAIQAMIVIPIAFAGSDAFALTTLKQVQVSNGSQVDLLFDGKVKPEQIKTEFFNDIIQVSVSDAAVYPAKISSINGDSLAKIFAYQYAPKLVRCRLTVRGKAEDFKDLFQIKANGKVLSLKLAPGTDQLMMQSSAPVSETARVAPAQQQGVESPKAAEAIKISEAEEQALLERVLKSDAPPARKEKKEPSGSQSGKLAGGKPLPSPWSAFGKLALVLGLFLGLAFLVKKFKGASAEKAGILSAVGRFARGTLGKPAKMIEVVSTHHLGPKKSIAVVRIAGRTLVLGVSNESINLITQINEFGGDGEADPFASGLSDGMTDPMDRVAMDALGFAEAKQNPQPKSQPQQQQRSAPLAATQAYASARSGVAAPSGASAAGSPMFADLLQSAATKPQLSSPSVRAQIRNRLEGLKQL